MQVVPNVLRRVRFLRVERIPFRQGTLAELLQGIHVQLEFILRRSNDHPASVDRRTVRSVDVFLLIYHQLEVVCYRPIVYVHEQVSFHVSHGFYPSLKRAKMQMPVRVVAQLPISRKRYDRSRWCAYFHVYFVARFTVVR
uniref:Uncharacterized protein n=1 Tax=Anopheles dirus TaxID=7168 RepID=A0A182NQM9_9DIPT